jgi:Protein of unknown function (DUF2000)
METYEVQNGESRVGHGYASDEMSTGERTGAAKLKWVVILDQSLSPGQAVNAAVCVYDDYLRELAKTHPDDLAPLAISLIGPRNQVAKLVRHLELLP